MTDHAEPFIAKNKKKGDERSDVEKDVHNFVCRLRLRRISLNAEEKPGKQKMSARGNGKEFTKALNQSKQAPLQHIHTKNLRKNISNYFITRKPVWKA